MSKQRQCRGKAKSFFNRMGIGFGTVFLGLMTAASGTPRMPVKTTAAEGIGGITVESISASPSSESVKTDVRFEENGTAELYIRIKSGDDVISESSQSVSFVENEIKTFTLNRPLEYASGKIEVIYSLTDNAGAVLDEEKIPMKNSVVQLSEDSIECVVNEMTIEEKAQLVTGYNVSGSTLQPSGVAGGSYAIERLGIPQIVMADGPVGVRIDTNAGITNTYGISYPSEALLACSWNTETVRTVGAALGRDCKDFGIDFILGPGLNIQRSILGGRNFEYFSEDSYLTGVMGTAYVEGIQSEGTGATIKHFAGNNQETRRGETDTIVSERALREIYLRAFETVVKNAEPWSLMTSYNSLNGIHTGVNAELVTDILRGEWGFDGFVVSDWNAAGGNVEMVQAQNDIYMPGGENFKDAIKAAIEKGTLTEEEINRSCKNILRSLVKTSSFQEYEISGKLDYERNREISEKAAAESMVLLKNDDSSLPLADGELAVFGNAQKHTVIGGLGASDVNVEDSVNIMEGLENSGHYTLNSKLKLLYERCPNNPIGITEDENPEFDNEEMEISDALIAEAAESSSAAVICISRVTREGKDHTSINGDYRLNDKERSLIERTSETFHSKGKKVVVVLNSGNPMETASWSGQVDAILYAGLAGQNMGNAVADILSGEVNPSGKLAVSWPVEYSDSPCYENFPGAGDRVVYEEDIYVGYKYYETFGVEVEYPFGYGLSYTSFEYGDLEAEQSSGGNLTFRISVKNTGTKSGKEAVQLYVGKPDGKLEQPVKQLISFGKTKELAPGESETLTMTVTEEDLKSYDEENSAWIIEKGDYKFYAGASVSDIRSEKIITRESDVCVQDVENKCVPRQTIDRLTKEGGIHTEKEENILLGKTSSSDYSEGLYLPGKANDGDFVTRWSGLGDGSSGVRYWQVDLGEAYYLEKIKIYFESIGCGYKIQTKLNEKDSWTDITYIEYPEELSFEENYDKIECRYIRITFFYEGGNLSIFEVQAFGDKVNTEQPGDSGSSSALEEGNSCKNGCNGTAGAGAAVVLGTVAMCLIGKKRKK